MMLNDEDSTGYFFLNLNFITILMLINFEAEIGNPKAFKFWKKSKMAEMDFAYGNDSNKLVLRFLFFF